MNIINPGTVIGYSVLDMIKAFEEATGQSVPYIITERRAGDSASVYSNPSKSEELLGWKAENGIKETCFDACNRQKNKPNGYE